MIRVIVFIVGLLIWFICIPLVLMMSLEPAQIATELDGIARFGGFLYAVILFFYLADRWDKLTR